MKFILLFLFIITSIFITSAQELECGTIPLTDLEMESLPWYGNNNYLIQLADSLGLFDNNENRLNPDELNEVPTSLFKVPIQFWVNRNCVTELEIEQNLTELNQYFNDNDAQILFYMTCGIIHTDNVDYDFVEDNEIDNVVKENYRKGVINVSYVLDSDFAGVFRNGLTKDGIIINATFAANSTLAHEIGHYFNLQHTHRKFDANNDCNIEAVSRTRECCTFNCINCEKKGDALCDTPADPNLRGGNAMRTCAFLDNTLVDPFGDLYITNPPDVSNIMSYMSPRTCRDNFTNSQITVMVDKLLKRGYGHSNEDPAEKYFFDQYEPDNGGYNASEITIGTEQHHTFHWTRTNNTTVHSCDVDWFRFDIGSGHKGIPIVIETNPGIFNDADTEIFIHEGRYGTTPIGSDDNSNENNYSKFILSPKSGSYFVEIKFKNELPSHSIIDYTIEINECIRENLHLLSNTVKTGEVKYFYAKNKIFIGRAGVDSGSGGIFKVESGGTAYFIAGESIEHNAEIIVEEGGIAEFIIAEIDKKCCND